jgi:hypothetical protein
MRIAWQRQNVVGQLSKQPPRWQAAGLQERSLSVQSAMRKAGAARQGRSCQWSESGARVTIAPDDDRAFWGKVAQVQIITLSRSRQTGMGSPCARFPDSATRPMGGAT